MKKKIVSLILALILIGSFVCCDSSGQNNDTQIGNEQDNDVQVVGEQNNDALIVDKKDNNVQIGDDTDEKQFNTTVSYANWTDSDEFFSASLNYDSVLTGGAKHLPVYKFDTSKDLELFKSTFGETLTMDHGYDEVPSFNNVTALYDDTFFEDNALILVYVDTTSGSYRFGVDSVVCADDSLYVKIKCINDPECVTDDMAGWFITVAVPKDTIENIKVFDAMLYR